MRYILFSPERRACQVLLVCTHELLKLKSEIITLLTNTPISPNLNVLYKRHAEALATKEQFNSQLLLRNSLKRP